MPKDKPVLLSDQLRALLAYPGSNWGDVKSALRSMLTTAESLESGQALEHTVSQVMALEAQIKDVQTMHKAELEELNSENRQLQSLLEQSNTEVNRLRNQQSEGASQQTEEEPVELPVDAVNILLEICEAPYSARVIADVLGLHRVLVQHHLNAMHPFGFVEVGSNVDAEGNAYGAVWLATSKGIGYLVDHGCFGPPTEKKEWPKTAVAILLELSEQPGPIPADVIAFNILEPKVALVQYFLDAMTDPDYLVRAIYSDAEKPVWEITKDGTAYLYHHGHLTGP